MKKFTVDEMILKLDELVSEYKKMLQEPPKGVLFCDLAFLREEIDLFENIILELNNKKGLH